MGIKEDALACVRMALEMKIIDSLSKKWRSMGVAQPLIFASASIVILVRLGMALWIDLITPLSEMVSTWHPDLNPMQMSIRSDFEDIYLLIEKKSQ